MSRPADKPDFGPDFDQDEDLFDFQPGELEAVAQEGARAGDAEVEDIDELLASFRAGEEEEALLDVPSTQPEPAPPFPASSRPALLARSDSPPAEAPSDPASTVPAPPPPKRAARLPKGILAIALAVTILNAGVAVVGLRRPARPPLTHAPARPAPVEPAAAPEEHALAPAPALPDPPELTVLHAHPALAEAREELTRGEYSTARRRVYQLLAVIDRLEDPRRSALEADCQFLIAQSLHLEALAGMGLAGMGEPR